jgi:hypothetical protein
MRAAPSNGARNKAAAALWPQFGDVRCVHMRERRDRARLVARAQALTGLPIRFYYATRHPRGGVEGCYESHVAVMREALADGLPHVLVLEDDLQVAACFSAARVQEVLAFMRGRVKWDVVFLGCFPDVWRAEQRRVSGNVYAVTATQTHAYVVSRGFMERMVRRPFDGAPIDEVFAREGRCFATLPSLFTQAESSSDVSSVAFVSALPAKALVASAVEAYARHVGVPLRQLLARALALCVVVKLAHELLRGMRKRHGRDPLR